MKLNILTFSLQLIVSVGITLPVITRNSTSLELNIWGALLLVSAIFNQIATGMTPSYLGKYKRKSISAFKSAFTCFLVIGVIVQLILMIASVLFVVIKIGSFNLNNIQLLIISIFFCFSELLYFQISTMLFEYSIVRFYWASISKSLTTGVLFIFFVSCHFGAINSFFLSYAISGLIVFIFFNRGLLLPLSTPTAKTYKRYFILYRRGLPTCLLAICSSSIDRVLLLLLTSQLFGDYMVAYRLKATGIASLQIIKRWIADKVNTDDYSIYNAKRISFMYVVFVIVTSLIVLSLHQYFENIWINYLGSNNRYAFVIFCCMAIHLAILPLSWFAERISLRFFKMQFVITNGMKYHSVMFVLTFVACFVFYDTRPEVIPLVHAILLTLNTSRLLYPIFFIKKLHDC